MPASQPPPSASCPGSAPFSGHRPPGSDRAWPAGPCPWSASGPGCSSLSRPCSPGAGNACCLPPSAAQLLSPPSVRIRRLCVASYSPRTQGWIPGLRSGAPGSPSTKTEGEDSAWKRPTPGTPEATAQKNFTASAWSMDRDGRGLRSPVPPSQLGR